MVRTAITPDELFDSTKLQYTPAIVTDNTFHVSGQVARDVNGNVVGEDIDTQARKAFDNIECILAEINKGFDDVVKVTSYVVDIHDHYDAFKSVYGDVFDEPYPCHTMLGVAGLANEALLVELEVDITLD